MLDLADVLELMNHGLDERLLAGRELVAEGEQPIVRVLAQRGDELSPLRDE